MKRSNLNVSLLLIPLKWKRPIHDKGSLDNAKILLNLALLSNYIPT